MREHHFAASCKQSAAAPPRNGKRHWVINNRQLNSSRMEPVSHVQRAGASSRIKADCWLMPARCFWPTGKRRVAYRPTNGRRLRRCRSTRVVVKNAGKSWPIGGEITRWIHTHQHAILRLGAFIGFWPSRYKRILKAP